MSEAHFEFGSAVVPGQQLPLDDGANHNVVIKSCHVWVTPGSASVITGLSCTNACTIGQALGLRVRLTNRTSTPSTIKHLDAGSLPENRVLTPTSADVVVGEFETIEFWWDDLGTAGHRVRRGIW